MLAWVPMKFPNTLYLKVAINNNYCHPLKFKHEDRNKCIAIILLIDDPPQFKDFVLFNIHQYMYIYIYS